MDLACPVCGEPWDLDELHALPGVSFAAARRRFATDGCALFETRHNDVRDVDTAVRSSVLFSLLGDDLDGIAGLMDDVRS